MRKVYIYLVVSLQVSMDEGIKVSDVMGEMDYDFKSTTPGATIDNMEILDHEVTDSK